MLGNYGWGTVGYAALASFFAVLAGAVAVRTKLGARWLARKISRSFSAAFGEAVKEHVKPELDAIVALVDERADRISAEAIEAAQNVSQELARHTADEGELVRAVVKSELANHAIHEATSTRALIAEEIAPLAEQIRAHAEELDAKLVETQTVLSGHIVHDEETVSAAAVALTSGQERLVARMDEQHDELLARIEAVAPSGS